MLTTRQGPARRWPVLALFALCVTVMFALGACCTLGLKNCAQLDSLDFFGDAKLNSCSAGEGSAPVKVRVYYLTDPDRFRAVQLEKLLENPEAELGASLVGSPAIVTVLPGKSVHWESLRPSGAAYVGIAANFCSLEGTWREVISLNEIARSEIRLTDVTLSVDRRK